MTRDWLLGFPPVLLAQDDQMPCSDEGLHFPLGIPDRAYADYKSRPEYKRTRELMAFEMIKARPEITEADCRQVELQRVTYVGGTSQTGSIFVSTGPNEWVMFDGVKPSAYDEGTFTVSSAPVGAEFATAGSGQVKTSSSDVTFTAASETLTIELDQNGAWHIKDDGIAPPAPTTPPGVWRKTAEHKPPVGVHKHLRGNDGTVSTQARYFDGTTWCASANPSDATPSCRQTWQWLDTSGEFKVGDRVRIGVSEHGSPERLCGAIGRVAQKIDDDFGVRVDGESRAWWYRPNELEHA